MTAATLARQARESLAKGLQVLQAPDSPGELLTVTRPLAAAMERLADLETQVELGSHRTDGVQETLQALRDALQLLQAPEYEGHSASKEGLSSIANTLGLVRELASALQADAGEVPPPRAAGDAAGDANAGDALRVEASLGAHSATNFYKGLSPGDVVASGGLFVETYAAMQVGQKLLLDVTLPGGYSFQAPAKVEWIRSAGPGGGPPPGFGASFLEVDDDARKLIQRYVRNREPLFHDDL